MKKFSLLKSIIALVCVVLLLGGGYLAYSRLCAAREKKQAINALRAADCEGVFLSMYDISTFSEEDFLTYLALRTRKSDYRFQSAEDLNAALEAVFASDSAVTHVYIGIDPLLLWHSAKDDIFRVQEIFDEGWLLYADAHPEVSFEILFNFPSMDYWMSLAPGERDAALILYQQITDILGVRSNIKLYYAGGQEWLINNPANYIQNDITNEGVSRKLFLLTFCDHKLRITGGNAEEMLGQTTRLFMEQQSDPAHYPDLSGYDIVFFGDSIFGNYEGSLSVPGIVAGLSGASTYNCAQGGTSAAEPFPDGRCFPSMVRDFLAGQTTDPDSTFGQGVQSYASADHSGKKLCFVINYGLNDYFGGLSPENPKDDNDITSYAGALRTGIRTLQAQYPDATYLLVGPGAVTYFENGTQSQSEEGGVLIDYYELSAAVSEELNIPYMDLYQGFPGEGLELTDVLDDGCHYGEYGRFLLGQKIIRSLEALLP